MLLHFGAKYVTSNPSRTLASLRDESGPAVSIQRIAERAARQLGYDWTACLEGLEDEEFSKLFSK